MKPKGKLFALFAIFAAIGLVTATGAFTTVQAERTVSVSVAGDQNALLQLDPHTGPNGDGEYSRIGSDDQLDLIIGGQSGGIPGDLGEGPNLNARTEIDLVFNITNQGTQSVGVWITKDGDNPSTVEFWNGTAANPYAERIDDDQSSSPSNKTVVGTGETIQVSMRIDTRGASLSSGANLINSITINADADEA